MELVEKEDVLKENIKDIAQLDEAILLIDEQYNELLVERKRIEEETKIQDNLITSWNGIDISSNADNGNPENGFHKKLESVDSECNSELPNSKFYLFDFGNSLVITFKHI